MATLIFITLNLLQGNPIIVSTVVFLVLCDLIGTPYTYYATMEATKELEQNWHTWNRIIKKKGPLLPGGKVPKEMMSPLDRKWLATGCASLWFLVLIIKGLAKALRYAEDITG